MAHTISQPAPALQPVTLPIRPRCVRFMDARARYQSSQALLHKVIAATARRMSFDERDAEDFASHVHVKLLEKDCRVLADYRGESSLAGYLSVVVQRLGQDYRNHRWGKWRPSAEAKRNGEVACLVETLTIRDGYSLDQAYQTLTVNYGLKLERRRLEEMVAALPVRYPRNELSAETLEGEPDRGQSADARLEETTRQALSEQVAAAMRALLPTLDTEERLILKMRFWQGIPLSRIAACLRLEQRPLYRRLEKILKRLREALANAGVGAEQIGDVLASSSGLPDLDFAMEQTPDPDDDDGGR